jgi:hypothetical protein
VVVTADMPVERQLLFLYCCEQYDIKNPWQQLVTSSSKEMSSTLEASRQYRQLAGETRAEVMTTRCHYLEDLLAKICLTSQRPTRPPTGVVNSSVFAKPESRMMSDSRPISAHIDIPRGLSESRMCVSCDSCKTLDTIRQMTEPYI